MLYKNCPRCTGDLYLERGIGYTEVVCLQCGYRRTTDPKPMQMSGVRARREVMPRRVAA